MFGWWRRSPTDGTTAVAHAAAHLRSLTWPDERAPLAQTRFAVVDTETTGPDPRRAELLAIGTCFVDEAALRLDASFEVPVRPATPSGEANILIHGIGKARQSSGLPVGDAIAEWVLHATPAVLVGYHALFDATVIARHARAAIGARLPMQWLDVGLLLPALTTRDAPRVRPLDHWLDRFGIRCTQRHGALPDAFATAQLLLIVLDRARLRGIGDVRGLRALQHDVLKRVAGSGTEGTGI